MNNVPGLRKLASDWPVRCGAWLALVVTLAGCTVGPDFLRPERPQLSGYTASAAPKTMTAGSGQATQRIQPGAQVSARWWRLFRSPALDQVIRYAIRNSNTLAAADASLAAARESVIAARGGLFPQVDVGAEAGRSKSAGAATPGLRSGAPISDLYSLGPTVSYALDVFGGTRRKVEQQQALADLRGYQLAAAYLTLTGDVVTQAINIASLRAQIQATNQVIADDQRNLALVRQAFKAGKVARTDVLTAETQLASDRTSLPPLRQQLSAARHALAILTGRPPAVWSAPDFGLSDFTLPSKLPLSLPSKLVRQRPDILAAEAQLHADSAAIGVATAQLYPNITLTAAFGQQSAESGTLFNAASQFWSLSAGLLAPVFQGGTLQAQRRAAVDTYKASLASYKQTVLQGFQQVADTLRALAHDAALVNAQRQLLDTASQALRLQRISYAGGKTTILNLIDSERTYQQARLGLVRAQAQRLQDSAQLFVALGGGWWQSASATATNSGEPNASQAKSSRSGT